MTRATGSRDQRREELGVAEPPPCPGCHTFGPTGHSIEHEEGTLDLWLERTCMAVRSLHAHGQPSDYPENADGVLA